MNKAFKKRKEKIEKWRDCYNVEDHHVDISELAARLHSNLSTGLTSVEAEKALIKHGPNSIQVHEGVRRRILLTKFVRRFQVLVLLLIPWCFYKFSLEWNAEAPCYHYLFSGLVLLLMKTVPMIVLFVKVNTKKETCSYFAKNCPAFAKVVRNGELHMVDSSIIVPGDIIEIVKGDIVPADARIIWSEDLKVDLINITGQLHPLNRSSQCTNAIATRTENMVFLSSLVIEGKAMCIVVATGLNTYIGRIVALATSFPNSSFDLMTKVNLFVRKMCAMAIMLLIVYGIIFFLTNFQLYQVMSDFSPLVFLLANLPETIYLFAVILIYITESEAKDNEGNTKYKFKSAIVPPVVGLISVLCINKSGILTDSCLQVCRLYIQGELREFHDFKINTGFPYKSLARAACLSVMRGEKYTVSSDDVNIAYKDPVQNAIYVYFQKFNTVTEMHSEYPLMGELQEHKSEYICTVHKSLSHMNYVVVVYGDYKSILSMCSTQIIENQNKPLHECDKKDIENHCKEINENGEHIVAFCDYILPLISNDEEIQYNADDFSSYIPWNRLRFVGILTFGYPISPFVQEAISTLQTAGVRTVMISDDDEDPRMTLGAARKMGIVYKYSTSILDDDETQEQYPSTSFSIAQHIKYSAGVYSGVDLRKMSADDIKLLLKRVPDTVFVNLEPQQKNLLVRCIQSMGKWVAYFGSGPNDFVALKQANVAVTFNTMTSGPSTETSDVIIYGNRLMTFVNIVQNGRELLENYYKSIMFIMTLKISQFLPIIIHRSLGLPAHINVWLIILGDLLVLIPAAALFCQKPEIDMMLTSPTKHLILLRKLLLSTYGHVGMFQTVAGLLSYHMVMMMYGFSPQNILYTLELWDSKYYQHFRDGYGQQWTYKLRKNVETTAQSAFFTTTLISQLAFLICLRFRNSSMFGQTIMDRKIFLSILTYIVCILIILNSDFCNTYFSTRPVPIFTLIPTLLCMVGIFMHEEFRKLLINKFPNSWLRDEYQ